MLNSRYSMGSSSAKILLVLKSPVSGVSEFSVDGGFGEFDYDGHFAFKLGALHFFKYQIEIQIGIFI
ncbi:MAG: hypothetical protein ABUK01_10425 [Leptospirales bacterium]